MTRNELTNRYKEIQDEVIEQTRKVWLAGLGAVASAERSSARLVDDLVDRGRRLEKRQRELIDTRIADAKASAESKVRRLEDDLEARAVRVFNRFGIPHRSQIRSLTERVEELTETIAKLDLEPETADRKVYHVVPHDEGWAVKAEGATRATTTHGTKSAALDAGRELAKSAEPSQLVIHRADGTVQSVATYGDE